MRYLHKSHCQSGHGMDVIDSSHNYLLESRGVRSVCIAQSEPWILQQCGTTQQLRHWGSGCYQVKSLLVSLETIVIIIIVIIIIINIMP